MTNRFFRTIYFLPKNIFRFLTGNLYWASGCSSWWNDLAYYRSKKLAIKEGRIYNKNGLPLNCCRRDGVWLEHEHADHPDYQFPINVSCECDDDWYVYTSFDEGRNEIKTPMTEEEKRWESVYSNFAYPAFLSVKNGFIKTIYETCYGYWDLETGKNLPGKDPHTDLFSDKEWIIDADDLKKIKEFVKCQQ